MTGPFPDGATHPVCEDDAARVVVAGQGCFVDTPVSGDDAGQLRVRWCGAAAVPEGGVPSGEPGAARVGHGPVVEGERNRRQLPRRRPAATGVVEQVGHGESDRGQDVDVGTAGETVHQHPPVDGPQRQGRNPVLVGGTPAGGGVPVDAGCTAGLVEGVDEPVPRDGHCPGSERNVVVGGLRHPAGGLRPRSGRFRGFRGGVGERVRTAAAVG
jgi:hypothetical protein